MEKGSFNAKGEQLFQQAEKTMKGSPPVNRSRWLLQELNELKAGQSRRVKGTLLISSELL